MVEQGINRWQVVYTKQANKDAKKISASNLRQKVEELITLIAQDPFIKSPPFEKLMGDLDGAYSRRINIQHRLVYQIYNEQRTIKILRMWTHYE